MDRWPPHGRCQGQRATPSSWYVAEYERRSPLLSARYNLSTWAGRLVLDRTGLDGPFNVDLQWSVDHRPQFDAIGASASHYNIAADPSLPSIFTAVEEQLGLKLESQRAPVSVLV